MVFPCFLQSWGVLRDLHSCKTVSPSLSRKSLNHLNDYLALLPKASIWAVLVAKKLAGLESLTVLTSHASICIKLRLNYVTILIWMCSMHRWALNVPRSRVHHVHLGSPSIFVQVSLHVTTNNDNAHAPCSVSLHLFPVGPSTTHQQPPAKFVQELLPWTLMSFMFPIVIYKIK